MFGVVFSVSCLNPAKIVSFYGIVNCVIKNDPLLVYERSHLVLYCLKSMSQTAQCQTFRRNAKSSVAWGRGCCRYGEGVGTFEALFGAILHHHFQLFGIDSEYDLLAFAHLQGYPLESNQRLQRRG